MTVQTREQNLQVLKEVGTEDLQRCPICGPANIFLTSKLLTFLATPPIKLKLGLQIGGRVLIATHPGTNQTIYPIRSKEQLINPSELYLLDCSRTPPGLWMKAVHYFPGSQQSSSESIRLDCCTSSKISSAKEILSASGGLSISTHDQYGACERVFERRKVNMYSPAFVGRMLRLVKGTVHAHTNTPH